MEMPVTANTLIDNVRPGLSERSSNRVRGRVAIVTGAGSTTEDGVGIGHAISVLLAVGGAKVVVVDRDRNAALRTAAAIRAHKGDAVVAVADVASSTDCTTAVQTALDTYGRLDIVVNNAAILGDAATVEADDAAFVKTFDINIMGSVRLTRAAAPFLNTGSSIVNISSLGSIRSFAKLDYEASKGAVNSMVNTMAVQFGPRGIRVNGVAPGQVWTPMGQRRLIDLGMTSDQIAQHRDERAQGVPLGTEGSGWDIAAAVLFLASDDSSWITGQVLFVDGGQSGVVGYMPQPNLRDH
ncbi:SDR family oxidoreductase [Rhodococcus sp. USK10]|nr:SDR family oxidoreductase [Rhodococcus sp. USK10]